MTAARVSASPIASLTWVALDLETTGLDPAKDEVIEVGAVKYRGAEEIGVMHTLVSPGRPVSPFIQALTGITNEALTGAPAFPAIAEKLQTFLGTAPVVGHNIAFDLAFLRRRGVQALGPAYDTFDLASFLLPRQPSYTLGEVARTLGIPPHGAHRAEADARVAGQAFVALADKLHALPPRLLAAVQDIASRSDWPLRRLIADVAAGVVTGQPDGSEPGLEGLDLGVLKERLTAGRPLHRGQGRKPVEAVAVRSILGSGGPLARAMSTYEERPQQVQMAEAVAGVFSEGGVLVAEAGTGTGKSLAYLLPAALFALRNSERAVVSTNTIALQEQLITKDLPDAAAAIADAGEPGAANLRFALLKGRSNYICLRRWAAVRRNASVTAAEARTLIKLLLWLQETRTGDRGEINLVQQEHGVWVRLSAEGHDQDRGQCPFARRGLCFYQAARGRAESAHVLVVNHALLALDAQNGNLLPDYEHLIVDEAHNLEEVVTQQWGASVDEDALEGFIGGLAGGTPAAGPGLVTPLAALARSALIAESRRNDLNTMLAEVQEHAQAARVRVAALFTLLADFAQKHGERGGEYGASVRITAASRANPAWSKIDIARDDAGVALDVVLHDADRVQSLAQRMNDTEMPDREQFTLEAGALRESGAALAVALKSAVGQPDPGMIYWIGVSARDNTARLHSAPLSVGPDLQQKLFSAKQTVVLTSATLSIKGKLDYIEQRLGLEAPRELVVGSPFDYPRLVLAYYPSDMPEPSAPGYQKALEAMIADAARGGDGRTLVLFTGWASLRAARTALAAPLAAAGITVLAQGMDGTPRQLVEQFRAQASKMLLLGTGSFWEGVDIAGEALSVLIIARLPFAVPSDPVFAARSEQFEDPFTEYGVPQAVLRFKQGFGRLIRRKTDRGVLIVLDRRIQAKRYGAAFLDSIPQCTRISAPAGEVGAAVRGWLAKPATGDS